MRRRGEQERVDDDWHKIRWARGRGRRLWGVKNDITDEKKKRRKSAREPGGGRGGDGGPSREKTQKRRVALGTHRERVLLSQQREIYLRVLGIAAASGVPVSAADAESAAAAEPDAAADEPGRAVATTTATPDATTAVCERSVRRRFVLRRSCCQEMFE